MSEKNPTPPHAALQCATCLKEIPSSVAVSSEGQDYVHYFCGLDCRAAWEEKNKHDNKDNKRGR